MSYVIHCTKKLLDRIKPSSVTLCDTSDNMLGNWYATVLFWKPQVALLVNEKTLLPVLMPLAPAADLATRFPEHLAGVLIAHGTPRPFIEHELEQMNEVQYAKTSNRSVLGVMNQFSFIAEVHRDALGIDDLLTISLELSKTPCSPLYKTHVSPKRALQARFEDI